LRRTSPPDLATTARAQRDAGAPLSPGIPERPQDPILDTPSAGPVPGAIPFPDGSCRFTVWAPHRERVGVRFHGDDRVAWLSPAEKGYHQAVVPAVGAGALYKLLLDGDRELPDPASRSQPQGVHGPSEVIDPHFPWTVGSWPSRPLREHVFYELHVGTFTPEGTFAAAVERFDDLVELGITAIELMPIAPFAGARGWGYDGVYPWAVHQPYGGLRGLQGMVDEAHRRGLAVFLDVVYNHLGPEGNYLAEFGPYFTDRYRTPWGPAINVDDAHSDEVRRLLIGSALHWVEAARIDGLRLDAVHAIRDSAPLGFVEELTDRVHQAGRRAGRHVHVVAESNSNDPRLVRERALGGWGLDGQWNDDFHHALVTLLSGERTGYFRSYGERSHLLRALRDGFVYTGQYSAFHGRRHGRSPSEVASDRLVVFTQNHDQVGNRMRGERLEARVGFEAAKLAAGLVLLSPFVPLLFMGEEYGETAPFLYFTSHTDPDLAAAVREGRRREFSELRWQGEPPDPQSEETFLASKLRWDLRLRPRHRELLAWYRELLALRRAHPSLGSSCAPAVLEIAMPESGGLLRLRRGRGGRAGDSHETLVLANLDPEPRADTLPVDRRTWERVVDAGEKRFGGAGASSPRQLEGTAGLDRADAGRGRHAGGADAGAGEGHATIRLPAYGLVVYVRRTS
jgi:maltooligosyltrehalose trehalohydrolase